MKNLYFIIFYCFLTFGLCACAAEREDEINSGSCSANDFEMALFSGKKTYKTTEAIEIWAELEYVGEGGNITIWSGIPPLSFSLTDGGDFNIGTITLTVLKPTTLEKGEIYSFKGDKDSGWLPKDSTAGYWETFLVEEDMRLPAGKYTITAEGDFALSDKYGAEKSGLLCEIEIEVIQ